MFRYFQRVWTVENVAFWTRISVFRSLVNKRPETRYKLKISYMGSMKKLEREKVLHVFLTGQSLKEYYLLFLEANRNLALHMT